MNKKHCLLVFLIAACSINSLSQNSNDNVAASIETFFKKAETFGYSGNVLVAQKGKIIVKKGFGWQDREKKVKETDETVFDVGSITKQFTAAAIMKLQSQGKLAVSDRLSKFFTEAPDDKKDITIQQLLTHAAGFPGAIGDDYELVTADEFMKLAFKTKLLSAPGSQYEYSNVGYSILGIIIEKVSGKKYENYLHDQLFVPAGMMHTGYLLPRFKNEQLAVAYRNDERWGTMLEHPWAADGPGWHLKANGGILSTLDDMHKWYIALRNKTILPAGEISKLFVPYIKETGGETFYGYGWVIEPLENGDTLIWHNGGNGAFNTFMGFDLKNDLVIIVSSNSNDKIADDYALHVRELLSGNGSALPKVDCTIVSRQL
jgi:CubicO group peptidase (beta-lactamase class C family)